MFVPVLIRITLDWLVQFNVCTGFNQDYTRPVGTIKCLYGFNQDYTRLVGTIKCLYGFNQDRFDHATVALV